MRERIPQHPAERAAKARAVAWLAALSIGGTLHAQSAQSITNPTLVNGNATWQNLGGGNWRFTIASQSAIINFTSFGIPQNRQVEFIMSAGARVLNRVVGDFPTQINGTLLASGQVFLVNPAGVFIGSLGVVNVGALYAAAGDISNASFGLNGSPTPSRYDFQNIRGQIVNEGRIEAASGATLIGTRVMNIGNGNRGIVVGDGGVALMVAHDGNVAVFEPGPNPQLFALTGGGASLGGIGIDNSAVLEVGTGGKIQLGAGDLYSVGIRNTGRMHAHGGEIRMAGATIEQSGSKLDTGTLVMRGLDGAASRVSLADTLSADQVTIEASTVALTGATTIHGEGGGPAQATSIAITGDIVSSGGATRALTLESLATTIDGDLGGVGDERIRSLTATGDVHVSGAMRVLQDVTVTGTGSLQVDSDLDLGGNAAVAGGLSVGGNLTLANAGVAQSIVAGGALSVGGDLLAVLDASASALSVTVAGDVNAGGDAVIVAANGITLGGDVTAGNAVTLDAGGAGVQFDGDGVQTVSAGGALLVNGSATKAAGDMVLDAGTTLEIAGELDAQGSLSARSGAGSTFRGDVSAGGDLTLEASRIDLFGDLRGGSDAGERIALTGPVVLNADSRWSAHGIRVGGTIDSATPGAATLRLAAIDASLLSANVGGVGRLGGFVIENGFTQLGTTAGGLFRLRADHFTLAPSTRPAGMGVDLASAGHLVIEAGAFTMAQGTKATVLGDFTIDAGAGSVRLGDVNTTGVFEVDAASIVLVGRSASSAWTSIGPTLDQGLDFVSLGGFRFSVAPLFEGTGAARFASPGGAGDLNGTLSSFTMLDSAKSDLGISGADGGVVAADFWNGASFFDVIASGADDSNGGGGDGDGGGGDGGGGGSANEVSLATVLTRYAPQALPATESSHAGLTEAETQAFATMLGPGIDLRRSTDEERLDLGRRSALFEDQGRSAAAGFLRSAADAARAGVDRTPISLESRRFPAAQVREVLRAARNLEGVDPETKAGAIAALRAAFLEGRPLSEAARDAASPEQLEAMRRIGRFVELGVELGMSEAERWHAGRDGAPFPQSHVGSAQPFLVPASRFDADFWNAVGLRGAGSANATRAAGASVKG